MIGIYQRGMAAHEDILEGSAADAWALLVDWGGLLKWWPKEGPAAYIVGCELLHDNGAIPCGRRMLREDGSGGVETLLHADHVARRIYYTVDDGILPGLRNYMATTTVDVVDAGRSRMAFRSTFDVSVDVDPAVLRSRVESSYRIIASGISARLAAS